jgi:nucleotide-binding universal stress UspA family protein
VPDPAAPILVALDPGSPPEASERLAVVLARAMGAEVVLGTVFPIIRLRSYVHSRRYERLLREEAERFLEERADRWRAGGTGIPVRTASTGSPSAARGLHALAREQGAALVVVGPSHRHGAGWTVPGPMGSRFAHGAPCPVAAATGRIPDRLDRIGAAFAPTDEGRAALRTAAALAERSGASLRAISVAGPLPWMDIVQPAFEGETLPELYGGHLAFELESAVRDLPSAVTVESEVPAGAPAEVLAAATEQLDLLVCGSHGYGPLGEVVLGSLSRDLLERADCPLLIVPRAAAADEAPAAQARDSQSRSLSA